MTIAYSGDSIMQHYTYMLALKEPTDSRKFYIGVRSCLGQPENDLYLGSSAALTAWVKEHGSDQIDKTVLSKWDTREEAVSHEVLLHECFDVGVNIEFWNKSRQTSTKFDMTGVIRGKPNEATRTKIAISQTGKKASTETKAKMSKAQQNRKHTAETIAKMSAVHKGKIISAEQRAKISATLIGKVHTAESLAIMSANMKNKKWYTNGIKQVRRIVGAEPDGYVLGRVKRNLK